MGALRVGALALRVTTRLRPAEGERSSGDAVAWWAEGDALWVALLDVAGHGFDAARVAADALARLQIPCAGDPVSRLHSQRAAPLGRPVAVALGRVGPEAPELALAMVGNVRLHNVSGGGTPSIHEGQPGMWSGHFPNLRPLRLPIGPGQRVLLHSDGLSSATRLDAFPAGMSPHPLLTALAERWGRPHDDLSCLLLDMFDGHRWPFAD